MTPMPSPWLQLDGGRPASATPLPPPAPPLLGSGSSVNTPPLPPPPRESGGVTAIAPLLDDGDGGVAVVAALLPNDGGGSFARVSQQERGVGSATRTFFASFGEAPCFAMDGILDHLNASPCSSQLVEQGNGAVDFFEEMAAEPSCGVVEGEVGCGKCVTQHALHPASALVSAHSLLVRSATLTR
jgi:hypothetical protein